MPLSSLAGSPASKVITKRGPVNSADKLLTAGSKTYTYDAAGRTKTVTTGGSVTTLNYDYESRLTSISYPSGATNTFTYNGLDTRVSKADSSGSSTYMRDGAGVTDSVLTDGSATYTSGVSQRRSGATTYDLSDRLGSATRQTSSAQAVTATRTYDAFGLLVASTGTPTGPFGFAGGHGYQEDKDSGLKLLGHRYYDPSTGRFLTRDTAKDDRNWYGYCGNNPVRWNDSTGNVFGIDDIVLILVVIAVILLVDALYTGGKAIVDGWNKGVEIHERNKQLGGETDDEQAEIRTNQGQGAVNTGGKAVAGGMKISYNLLAEGGKIDLPELPKPDPEIPYPVEHIKDILGDANEAYEGWRESHPEK